MEGKKLQHFFHEHLLILKVEQSRTSGGNDHPEAEIKCDGCWIPISGPFYSCGECPYFLHKVCAELPSELDHPLHLEHPLTLLECSPYNKGYYDCSLCKEEGFCRDGNKFVYHCFICNFNVDMKCASASHVIGDKCHPHPLTSLQVPNTFACHICQKKEEGLSYKCNICPFWVHQNCTLIPDVVKHSDHSHLLKLFPSVPFKYNHHCRKCDICHSKLCMFQCNYSCVGCLFFAHVGCARSETIQSPSTSRDQNTDNQSVVFLPMEQDSTDLISRFVENSIGEDVNIDEKIDYFYHEHHLTLLDEKTTDKTCEACGIRISPPSYGCVDCDYFLHKCCIDLPKQIHHPMHPEHQLYLQTAQTFSWCRCCSQYCNIFFYECFKCKHFRIDIKCASLQGTVYYEGHKHPLIPIIKSSTTCAGCGLKKKPYFMLQCNTCSFELCFMCAMMPRVIEHRYGKSEPFILTYSPPENHYDEYICEICLKDLKPKEWFYHCVYADQFTHTYCMLNYGIDSNINYGKSIKLEEKHEHKLTMIRCTYDCSRCSWCRHGMRTGYCVGLECIPCNFRIHLRCPPSV